MFRKLTLRGKNTGSKPCDMPTFNVRPGPIHGEAWVGYLVRFAEVNGLTSAQSVLRHLDGVEDKALPQNPEIVLDQLNVVAGAWLRCVQPGTRAQTNTASPARRAKHEHSRYFRVCPGCLNEDVVPHIRSLWTHPLQLTCPTHSALLVDACEACGHPFDWIQPSVRRCRCGHDLAAMPLMPAPAWAIRIQALFPEASSAWMGATFAQTAALDRRAAKVAIWLLTAVDTESGMRPRVGRLGLSFLRCELAKNADVWGDGWPVHLLEELIHQFNPRRMDGRKRLRRYLDFRHFASMRELVKEVDKRMDELEAVAAKRDCAAGAVQDLSYVGPQHLSVITSLSPKKVISAVKAGHLAGAKLIKIGSRKKLDVRASHAVYEKIRKTFEESMAGQDVCRYLNLSWRSVRQLADEGVLPALALTSTGGTQRYWRKDVEALRGRVVQISTVSSASAYGAVSKSGAEAQGAMGYAKAA